jgi:hypothetical protein
MKIAITDPLTREILIIDSLTGRASMEITRAEVTPTLPISESHRMAVEEDEVNEESGNQPATRKSV